MTGRSACTLWESGSGDPSSAVTVAGGALFSTLTGSSMANTALLGGTLLIEGSAWLVVLLSNNAGIQWIAVLGAILGMAIFALGETFMSPTLPAIVNDQLVRLVDLSVKGARLHLDKYVEPGQMVVLVVVTDRGNITVKGEILWCEIDSLQIDAAEDHYLSGVAFRHEIAGIKMVIDDLRSRDLAILIEDNRDHDRYRVSAPLTGRFGQVEPFVVQATKRAVNRAWDVAGFRAAMAARLRRERQRAEGQEGQDPPAGSHRPSFALASSTMRRTSARSRSASWTAPPLIV